MLHRNLSPEAILINDKGAWKIAGFEYALSKSFGNDNRRKLVPIINHSEKGFSFNETDRVEKEVSPRFGVYPLHSLYRL